MRALPLALAALLVLASGCAGPPAAQPPEAGKFTMQLLGPSPSPTTMRWNVALANGNLVPMNGVKVSISTKFYGERDGGSDEQTFDLPANETKVVVLRTTYMGFGDYDYVLTARASDGTVLDVQQDLYEFCLC